VQPDAEQEQALIADARAVGARVVGFGRVPGVDGEPIVTARVLVEDGWMAARLLKRRCERDAGDPLVRQLAADLRRRSNDDGDLARKIHAAVQKRVRFVPEEIETFQGAAYTWQLAAGDCDDHVRLTFALARAAGLPVRLAFLQRSGQPAHVLAELGHNGAWHSAETTIAALYAEPPVEAARRLGITTRPDLDGAAVQLAGGLGCSCDDETLGALGADPPPPRTGSSWRNDPAWVRWAARLFERVSPVPLGPAGVQAALAVAAYETGIGRNLPGWNFGGVMGGGSWRHGVPATSTPIRCPADTVVGTDITQQDGVRRWVCWQKWPTPEAGARSWLATLTYHAGGALETGDADAIAAEMYRPKGQAQAGYFGGATSSGSTNVRAYAEGLAGLGAIAARLLGAPVLVKRSGSLGLVLSLGAALAAVVVLARRQGAA